MDFETLLEKLLVNNRKNHTNHPLLRIPVHISIAETAIAQAKNLEKESLEIWKNNCRRLAASLPKNILIPDKKTKTGIDPFQGIRDAYPSQKKGEPEKIPEIIKSMAGALKATIQSDFGDVEMSHILKILEDEKIIPKGETKNFLKSSKNP